MLSPGLRIFLAPLYADGIQLCTTRTVRAACRFLKPHAPDISHPQSNDMPPPFYPCFLKGLHQPGREIHWITIFITASPCHPVSAVYAGPKQEVERRQKSHEEFLEGVETEHRRYVLIVRVDG